MPVILSDFGFELVPKEHDQADRNECDDDCKKRADGLENERQKPDAELDDGGRDSRRDDRRLGRFQKLEENKASGENQHNLKDESHRFPPLTDLSNQPQLLG